MISLSSPLLQTTPLALLAGLALVPPPALAQPPESGGPAGRGPRDAPACLLTSSELRDRIARIERDLLPRVTEVVELPNGFALVVPNEEGQLARLAEFVDLESHCCGFLDFEIHVPSHAKTLSLVLTGPEGTKEILGSLLENVGGR